MAAPKSWIILVASMMLVQTGWGQRPGESSSGPAGISQPKSSQPKSSQAKTSQTKTSQTKTSQTKTSQTKLSKLEEIRRKRKAMLRDSSDLAIGLSIARYRDYVPPADLNEQRRRFLGLPEGDGYVETLTVFPPYFGPAPFFNVIPPFPHQPVGRSPLYDWRPPQVRQVGRRWIIQPGSFDESRRRKTFSSPRRDGRYP